MVFREIVSSSISLEAPTKQNTLKKESSSIVHDRRMMGFSRGEDGNDYSMTSEGVYRTIPSCIEMILSDVATIYDVKEKHERRETCP